ncbi:hypothetical protein OKA04_05595 [Luteolibacter flavescens]|uniref:Uncharacterized protein n=1 Tax=Luteolibacter flavescens TaxID=1859460 RepID=A0ABT3FKW1_9BACT|nr:choice-of-anchor tandem repeat GloVer-containing protein [Luteolibacter flavescens]MCW1884195.1 hypothetical protein [Luteolibacter flavescens]
MRTQILLSLLFVTLAPLIQTLRADEPVFEIIETIKTKFNPIGDIVSGGDGYFYGAVRWADQYRGGAIIRVAPQQPVEIIHAFSFQQSWPVPNSGGSSPTTGLTKGADGAFYGVTQGGGAYGWGVIYRITREGDFSVILDVSDTHANGIDHLIAGPDGFLYGAGNYGGLYNGGRLFRVSLGGNFENLYDFPAHVEPSGPRSIRFGPGGKLYGMTIGGTLYRYDGDNKISQIANVWERGLRSTPQFTPTFDGFYVTTNWQLLHVSLTGEKTILGDFEEDNMGDDIHPVTSFATPHGLIGITYQGGEHDNGFIYSHVPGQGMRYLYQLGPEFNSTVCTLGQSHDGTIYGLAPLIERSAGSRMASSEAHEVTSRDEKAKGAQKTKASGQSFRLRNPAASTSNFFPLTEDETVILPEKAKNGVRKVVVQVLANDRDPDRDPLSLTGVSGGGAGKIEITHIKGKQSLLFATEEIDPQSRKIVYQVADGKGGESTGTLHLLSSGRGSYAGTASSGSHTGQMAITVGAGNKCNVSLIVAGVRYSGKASLDSSDEATVRLKAKGVAPAMARLRLERGNSRLLKAAISMNGALLNIDCTPK